jgi:hypothetical protein
MMIDLIRAIAALWVASGMAAWIAISDQRIQSWEFEFMIDLVMAIPLCTILGPFTFWVARSRLVKEERR